MVMHNKQPASLMIAIGLPHAQPDEDHLQREDHNEQPNGNDDPAEIRDRGPAGVRVVRDFASALEDMCGATMARDHAGLEDAADDAHQALNRLLSD
jgi:hypothetical protein